MTPRIPVPRSARDAAPAGEPVPGTEATVLWGPTRGKGEPASTERQASEGQAGGRDTSPQLRPVALRLEASSDERRNVHDIVMFDGGTNGSQAQACSEP